MFKMAGRILLDADTPPSGDKQRSPFVHFASYATRHDVSADDQQEHNGCECGHVI